MMMIKTMDVTEQKAFRGMPASPIRREGRTSSTPFSWPIADESSARIFSEVITHRYAARNLPLAVTAGCVQCGDAITLIPSAKPTSSHHVRPSFLTHDFMPR
jgi:hypothetical protein